METFWIQLRTPTNGVRGGSSQLRGSPNGVARVVELPVHHAKAPAQDRSSG